MDPQNNSSTNKNCFASAPPDPSLTSVDNTTHWSNYVKMISAQGIRSTDQQIDLIASRTGSYRISLQELRETIAIHPR